MGRKPKSEANCPIRIGLIGAGGMAAYHVAGFRKAGAQILAIADPDPEAAEAAAAKFDVTQVFDSADEMLARVKLDAVSVITPNKFHCPLVLQALKAGKHVFCEKPLCRDAAQMKRIVAAAKKAKTFFNVGLCVRAWPEYRHAYEYFKSGKTGKMKSATFKRISPSVDGNAWQNWFMDGARSGGALLDLHVHDADEVNYFFGMPKSVTAVGATGIVSKGGVDHVVATYDYGNGALVMAEGGWAAAKGTPFEMSFTIVCEKATLKLDASGYHIYPVKGKPITPKVDVKAGPTGWHQELAYFVNCVAKGVKPEKYQTLASVEDTMKLVFAEEKSVKSHRPVRL